jgi:hypothetical protein
MPAKLPADLYGQVTTFEIDPQRTARLAAVYYRSLARRLWSKLPELSAERPDGARQVRWMHPRTVFAALTLGTDRGPAEFRLNRPEYPELFEPESAVPKVTLFTGIEETWCRDSLGRLTGARSEVGANQPIRLVSELPAGLRQNFDDAIEVLFRVWPEAAVEFCLLIRCMVYVEGLEFGSATLPETFGAIYADTAELKSVPSAFEMLLHETAHHSLCVKNSYERFVLNELDLVSHPLRTDPRPIEGTLHAALVLTRITSGLTRWCREPGVPDEARLDLADMTAKLAATLDVLEEKTQWTPAGAEFFATLQAWRSGLAGNAAA